MGCCTGLSKFLLIVTNLVGLAVGIAIAVASGLIVNALSNDWPSSFEHAVDVNFRWHKLMVPLIVIGSTLAAICLIGLFGACCKSLFLLIIYAILLFIALVVEVVFSIFLGVGIKKMPFWGKDLYNAINHAVSDAWATTNGQHELVEAFHCSATGTAMNCTDKILDKIHDHMWILAAVAFGLGVFMLLLFVASIVICRKKFQLRRAQKAAEERKFDGMWENNHAPSRKGQNVNMV